MIYRIVKVNTIKLDPTNRAFRIIDMIVENENDERMEVEAKFTSKEWERVRNERKYVAD